MVTEDNKIDSTHQYDLLIQGGKIITMDPERRIIDNGTLVVSGNKILEIFVAGELPDNLKTRKTINADGKVIIPGLINAHSHIAMTLLRGIAEDLVLDKWLEEVWKYELAPFSEDDVLAGAKLALAEMVHCGVTCAHDMYFHYMAVIDLA